MFRGSFAAFELSKTLHWRSLLEFVRTRKVLWQKSVLWQISANQFVENLYWRNWARQDHSVPCQVFENIPCSGEDSLVNFVASFALKVNFSATIEILAASRPIKCLYSVEWESRFVRTFTWSALLSQNHRYW